MYTPVVSCAPAPSTTNACGSGGGIDAANAEQPVSNVAPGQVIWRDREWRGSDAVGYRRQMSSTKARARAHKHAHTHAHTRKAHTRPPAEACQTKTDTAGTRQRTGQFDADDAHIGVTAV